MDFTWDEDPTREIFWPIDANRREDIVAWNLTRIGVFSVGSVYHAQWEHKFRRKESNLNIASGKGGGGFSSGCSGVC